MTNNKLSELSDDELLEKQKKIHVNRILHAVLIGFLIGILAVAVYGAIKNGFRFFTLLPVLLLVPMIKSLAANNAVKKEIKSRNLE